MASQVFANKIQVCYTQQEKDENPASVRVIEKNGGKLEWKRAMPDTEDQVSCYWIDL